MHKTKTPLRSRILLTSGLALTLITGASLYSPTALAEDSQVQVLVGDVCPNIPGNQPTMPSGMQHDQNGDCFTPAPPPPPDACPNLANHQPAIPTGYYRNQAGDCVPQTTPPKDVCPNISGTQSSVPKEMYTSSKGECLTPAEDRCANVPGTQNPIPQGMERDKNGDCFTPTAPTGPAKTPTDPGSPSVITQTPDSIIPDALREILRHTSPTLARTLPYYLIGILVFVSLLLLWQTIGESLAAKKIFVIFKRKKKIAGEKDIFIAFSTQYLQTTIAAMLASLDTIASQGEVDTTDLSPLAQATSTFQLTVQGFLETLAPTVAPTDNTADTLPAAHTLRSVIFWIPVLLVGIIVLTANLLLGGIGGIDLGTSNLILEAAAFFAAGGLFYLALHTRRLRHSKRQRAQTLNENENSAEITRSSFIQQVIYLLRSGLQDIDTHRAAIADAPSSQAFTTSYTGLTSLLAKFGLLDQTDIRTSTKFNVRDVIEGALLLHQTAMDAKKLTVTDTSEDHEILQNRALLSSVIGSAFDTAIASSSTGGGLTVDTTIISHKLEIRISNNNKDMHEEELAQLFDPTQSDTPSSDLGLFLDRIIMEELGGKITASSAPGEGATFVVTVRA